MERKPFTDKEKLFLLENRLHKSSRQLSEIMGCSKTKVLNFFRNQNLKLPKNVKEKFRREGLKGRTTLTPDQDTYIQENYLSIPLKRIAENIGRSGAIVRIRLRQLGLEVPKEIIQQRKSASQIKKGEAPWNKGKKQSEYMSAEMIEKTKKNRFKKGSIPHNTKYDGYERITKDGYTEVRISQGKFELKHRIIWRENNGEIPGNHIVVFKDSNPLNCTIENLELISMRENMHRNILKKYPKEVRSTKKLIWKLNNKIKDHGTK